MAACLLLSVPAHATKQEASVLINFSNDFANALKPAELNALERQLVEISQLHRYQIAVAIYPKLPAGAERDDATELADKLLVGSAVDNRGLVIFVFLAEKAVRIEVGYGLEDRVPDAHASRIAGVIAGRIAKGEMALALQEAIAGLEPALRSLEPINPQSTRWEWLPDIVLSSIDAVRGIGFFMKHRHEIPKQLASWWKSNDAESRVILTGIGAIISLVVLGCLRPAVGTALCMALPSARIPRRAMYRVFFWGTDAVYGKQLRPDNPRANDEVHGLFDLLSYSFAAFLVVGGMMALFIMVVGQSGGFGGAGAWARW